LQEGAHREVMEEAGVRVKLKGILRLEHSLQDDHFVRLRVFYFAEPVDPAAPLKTTADKESIGAEWLTLAQLQACARGEVPGRHLRGTELLQWAEYIEGGGPIYPMSLITEEGAPPLLPPPPVFHHAAASAPHSYMAVQLVPQSEETADAAGIGGGKAAATAAAAVRGLEGPGGTDTASRVP
jgi:hypothetical protein